MLCDSAGGAFSACAICSFNCAINSSSRFAAAPGAVDTAAIAQSNAASHRLREWGRKFIKAVEPLILTYLHLFEPQDFISEDK